MPLQRPPYTTSARRPTLSPEKTYTTEGRGVRRGVGLRGAVTGLSLRACSAYFGKEFSHHPERELLGSTALEILLSFDAIS